MNIRRAVTTTLAPLALTAGLLGFNADAASTAGPVRPPAVPMGTPCQHSWKAHWYSSAAFTLIKDVKWASCTFYNPYSTVPAVVNKRNTGL